VLYLIHRDALYAQDMTVLRTVTSDLDGIKDLIESSGETEQK